MDPSTTLLIVTGAALVGSVGQTVISVKIGDPEKLRELQGQLKDYLSDLEAAKKSSDKKLLKQMEKKKKYMDTLQSEVSNATMKMTILSSVFALLIFAGLYYLFNPEQGIAYLSTYLWEAGSGLVNLTIIYWYIVSSFYFSTIVRKLMRVS
mgnify:CR=1 FL=1